ncbi:MAG: hypothetical protein GXO79_07235 [Chlorobi bacterium]|nr:hypothetical protein [Chlorobiota bacterium]
MKNLTNTLFLLLIFLLFSCKDKMDISERQAEGFIKYFGSYGEDVGNDVKQTDDGGYLIVGTVTSDEFQKQMAIIKTDKYGNQLWNRHFGGDKDDFGNSFIIDHNGDIVIVGSTTLESDSTDIYVVKLTNNGGTIQTNHYGGFLNQEGFSIVENEDNNYLIGGNFAIDKVTDIRQTLILLINNNGDSIIDSKPYYSTITSLIKTSSNNYIITGSFNNKFTLTQIRPKGGLILSYPDLLKTSTTSESKEIISLPNGGYVSIGTGYNGTNRNDIFLLKLDNNFNYQWEKSFGETFNDEGNSIIINNENEIVILGTIGDGVGEGKDIYLIKTDLDGNKTDTKYFGGPGDESGNKIEITSDGGYIIVGSSNVEGNSMIMLIKTDNKGNI